jgi:hypothetical protein
MRSANRLIPVVGLRLASNPGGVSGTYIKNRFIKPTENGKKVAEAKTSGDTGKKLTRTVAYVHAVYSDNPYLDEGYESVLDSIEDPQRRAAMRDGDWDAIAGQFFEQWNRSRHVVSAFPVPASWQRYAGIDWGFRAPWAVVWGALDEDGRIWIYREKYATKVDTKDQPRIILESESLGEDGHVIRVADPSMWGNKGTLLSQADIYGQEGCGLVAGDNARVVGWSRVHYYLNDAPACEIHKEMGWERCPLLHVFEEECPVFIEKIPALTRSRENMDDAETRGEDHMPDALRYMLMYVGNYARPIFDDDSVEKIQHLGSVPILEGEYRRMGSFAVNSSYKTPFA